MTEPRLQPEWLEELYALYGEPRVKYEDQPIRWFDTARDYDDNGVPGLKTGWVWFPNSVNHSLWFHVTAGFTVVSASTHLKWKPPVMIQFSKDYGPSDRDVELILDLSQFRRSEPRFTTHETGDLRQPSTTGK